MEYRSAESRSNEFASTDGAHSATTQQGYSKATTQGYSAATAQEYSAATAQGSLSSIFSPNSSQLNLPQLISNPSPNSTLFWSGLICSVHPSPNSTQHWTKSNNKQLSSALDQLQLQNSSPK
jgi:hypothetical protein